MITNVNTIQKIAYTGDRTKDLQTYSDLFFKESLANLGQRFSVKGDGVSVSKFYLLDLFGETINDYLRPEQNVLNTYAYYAYVEATVSKETDGDGIDDYKCTLNIRDLYSGDSLNEAGVPDKNPAYLLSVSTNLHRSDKVVTTQDIEMRGSKVTAPNGEPIKYYKAGGVLYQQNGTFTTAFIGCDSSNKPVEVSVEKFDKQSKRVLDVLKVYKNGKYTFNLTHIHYLESEDVNVYSLDQYWINDSGNNLLENFFNSFIKSREFLESGLNICTLVNKLTEQNELSTEPPYLTRATKGTIYYSGDGTIDTDDGNAVLTGDLVYDPNLNDGIEFVELFRIDKNNVDIHTMDLVESCVITVNQDLHRFYPYILKKYNEDQYFQDNTGLKSDIVRELLIKLYNDYIADSEGDNKSDYTAHIYFPYNYEFIYSCNSNNMQQIYASVQDMTVESCPIVSDELYKIIASGGYLENLIIVGAQDVTDSTEKIFSIYKFTVPWDDDSNLYDTPVVSRYYILPYINDDGYWTINNIDTDIYARGKDGGQPSVMVTYTDTSLDEDHAWQVLSTLNKDELTTAIDWQPTYFYARPLNTNANTGRALHHVFQTYMPTKISYLNENLITFLKHALIMNVNSVHSECTDPTLFDDVSNTTPLGDPGQLGEDGIITTFWALQKSETSDDWEFTYLKQPGTDWALDFNYLSDAEGLTRFYLSFAIEPDEHYHRWLVFSAVKGSLKHQQSTALNYEACPVLITRDASVADDIFYDGSEEKPTEEDDNTEQSSNEPEVDSLYRNNLNFTPAFFTRSSIDEKQGRIKGVQDSNVNGWRYFYLDPWGRLPFTYETELIDNSEVTTYTYAWSQVVEYPEGQCIFDQTGYNNPANDSPYASAYRFHYMGGSEGADPEYRSADNTANFGGASYTHNGGPWVDGNNDTSFTKTAYEWYPNTLYGNEFNHLTSMLPVFDLKEMFVRNFNVLNRTNVLSTDSCGYMYYSYFGTSFKNPDKRIIHLGTAKHDINLGLKTLTDSDSRQHFNQQRELDIDFEEIVNNGNVTFRKGVWQLYEDPEHPDKLKMWSTLSELQFIGKDTPLAESIEKAADNSYKYFCIENTVAYAHTDIGGSYSTEDTPKYDSFIDLDWWCGDVLNITYYKDQHGELKVSGGGHSLVNYKDKHYLKLTTYLMDGAVVLPQIDIKQGGHNEHSYYAYNYWYKCNPLNISYTMLCPDKPELRHILVNVREVTSEASTAYALYHGGDLSALN